MNSIKETLQNWIPSKLIFEKDIHLCRWLYTKNQPFTDPFFGETVMKCLPFPENSKQFKCTTSVEMIAEWAQHIDAVYPTAFIFHVSRCGSTLVSQALGMNSENISLSEVALFDELLKLPMNEHNTDDKKTNELLAGAITFYGARRTFQEKRLFIKTDSWHLFFYEQLRALYPNTPFIILYRTPDEVLKSNSRKKGMQGNPEFVPPSLFGFNETQGAFMHPDQYMALVLEKYFCNIIEIATNDGSNLLLNYNEGLSVMMQKIAAFTGMELSPAEEMRIAERSAFDAKNPAEKFVEKNMVAHDNQSRGKLAELYDETERLRDRQCIRLNFPR